MKQKDKDDVQAAVDNEGFDYCFVHWSSFGQIKDKEFHALREAYIAAHNKLAAYIGLEEY